MKMLAQVCDCFTKFLRSGRAILLIISLVVLYGQAQEFRVPQGDLLIPKMAPGAADFAWTFSSALALKHGENPYFHDNEIYYDPYGRIQNHEGKNLHAGYPPSHFLLYLPLTLVTEDWVKAANLFFGVNLLLIVLLAWIVKELIQDLDKSISPAIIFPLLILIIGGFEGTRFALERGQSDIINSVLVWGGLLCFLRNRFVFSGLLLICAAALKGYGAFLWLGIFLIALFDRNARDYMIGSIIGMVVFVAPVLNLIPDAIELVLKVLNSDAVTPNPIAYSFRNLAVGMGYNWIEHSAILCSYLVSTLVLLRIRLLPENCNRFERTLWLVSLTICLLIIPLGKGSATYHYSLVILIPGYLLLGLAFEYMLLTKIRFEISTIVMVILIAFINVLIFKINIRGISSAGIANFLFLMVIGFYSIYTFLIQKNSSLEQE